MAEERVFPVSRLIGPQGTVMLPRDEITRRPMTHEHRDSLLQPELVRVVGIDLMMVASAAILTPAISLYVTASGGGPDIVGAIASAYMFASIVFRPFAGTAVSLAGEKRVLLLSIGATAVAGALLPPFLSLALLVAVRIIQGIGWAYYSPASSTVMSEMIPRSRRGEGFGYVSMARNVGVAGGSVAGLALVEQGHFELAFFAAWVCSVAALGMAARLPEKAQRTPALAEGALRLLIEPRALAPSMVSASMTFVMGALTAFVPVDAQERNVGSASAFFLIFTAVLMVMRPLSGRLSDRLQSRGVLIVPGLALAAASTAMLAMAPGPFTLPIAALLWGLGFGLAQPVLRAMVLDRCPRERWAAANATTTGLYDLGLALGPLVLGMVANRTSMAFMFGLASAIPIAASVLTFATGLHKERSDGG